MDGHFNSTRNHPRILEGQLTVWVLYAIVIGLLVVGLFQSSRLQPSPAAPPGRGWLRLQHMVCFALILGTTACLSRAILGEKALVWTILIWLFLTLLAFVLAFMTIRELIKNDAGKLKRKEDPVDVA